MGPGWASSSRVAITPTVEAVRVVAEIVAADEAMEVAKDALAVPREATETINEVTKMVEMGRGVVVAMNQATCGVYEVLNEASNGHDGDMEIVTTPSTS